MNNCSNISSESKGLVNIDDEVKRLFNIRKIQKSKKPKFNKYCYHKFKRLSKSWRRPRGLQSKQRRGILGKGSIVKIGYGSPSEVRGLHPSGYDEVMVYNIDDLSLVSQEYEAIRISSSVGSRKRIDIINKAKELEIKILNSLHKVKE